MAFEAIVETMMDMGLLELFFPWLLVTAITFGALKQWDTFEEDSVIGAISVSVGFIALAGIYVFAPEGMFANFGAAIAFAFFGLLGLAMVMGLAGVSMEGDDIKKNPIAIAGLLLVTLAFVGVLGVNYGLGFLSNITIGSEMLMQVFVLVFIVVIIGIVSRNG